MRGNRRLRVARYTCYLECNLYRRWMLQVQMCPRVDDMRYARKRRRDWGHGREIYMGEQRGQTIQKRRSVIISGSPDRVGQEVHTVGLLEPHPHCASSREFGLSPARCSSHSARRESSPPASRPFRSLSAVSIDSQAAQADALPVAPGRRRAGIASCWTSSSSSFE